MHTAEILHEALEVARRAGIEVRQDWLGGNGGGHCLVRGRKLLLLDIAQSTEEQLDIVVEALQSEPEAAQLVRSRELASRLQPQRIAA